jgi:F420-non-reducing hydrogenase small subunit
MVKVAEEWLNSCSGCEIAILNIGDALIDLLPSLEFVHIPVLIDKKYYGQTGEGKHLEIPKAVVGIVSGGVKNSEHLEVLHKMRESCDILIALGTCATDGGLPALANMYTNDEIREFSYHDSPTTVDKGVRPNPDKFNIPHMLERCTALDEHVKVDIKIPGCPPHPEWIAGAVLALLDGKTEFKLPERSVCDVCPTKRERKKSEGGVLKRMLETPEFDPEKPVSDMRCLLEQGFMCLGPVTRAGCGGMQARTPRCISARVPCRGCYGPVRESALPLIDYVGALASVGYDPAKMPDRRGFLARFSGGHGVLKKI